MRDREPQRYGRAAVRWLARFCDEEAGVDLDEATLVVALWGAENSVPPANLSIPTLGRKFWQRTRRARGRRD